MLGGCPNGPSPTLCPEPEIPQPTNPAPAASQCTRQDMGAQAQPHLARAAAAAASASRRTMGLAFMVGGWGAWGLPGELDC